jgi:Inositol hexakisphosphate
VRKGLVEAADFVFNCQMGRGRTTTGMVTACLIATTDNWTEDEEEEGAHLEDMVSDSYDPVDGPSEEEAYMQGDRPRILWNVRH